MDRETCIKKISKYIGDDEVRAFLFDNQFGKEDFLTTIQQIYKAYSNIFNLTFALIYSKYRKWKSSNINLEPENMEKFNSYMRITKTFGELYKGKMLGFSTIEPTIIDAQLDIYYDGIISKDVGMSEYFNRDSENRFAYFTRCAELARHSSRLLNIKEDISSKYNDLIELLSLFPYLEDIELVLNPITPEQYGTGYIFEGDEKYEFDGINKVTIKIDGMTKSEELDTYFTLLNVDGKYYYLQNVLFDSIDNDRDKKAAYLSYSQPGIEEKEFNLVVAAFDSFSTNDGDIGIIGQKAQRTVIRDLRLNASDATVSNALIRDFYAINYMYVKQLSMAISDIFTDEIKHRLKAQYQSKHPTIFNTYSWDSTIAILLVKESATNVLRFLFANSSTIYDRLLHSLQSRFGSDVFNTNKLKEETATEVKSAFERWCIQYLGDKQSANEIINEVVEEQRTNITAEIRALKMVAYLSDLTYVDDSNTKRYKSKYPLNINSHIKMLELLRHNSDLSMSRRLDKLQTIVLKTLKSLYIFYCGFFSYAKVKNDYKDSSRDVVLTVKQVDDFQKKANSEFRREVAMQQRRLSDSKYNSVEAVLDEIERLNDECMFGTDTEAKAKRKILRENLGKYQLLDFSEIYPLKSLVNCENPSDEMLNARITSILEIYKYLQNGKGEENQFEGIYPYVGTFEYAHETRDGYKIAHFSISIPGRSNEMDIEMVSEFQYTINNKYYCLPNVMCSNNDIKLWIEPTLIDYGNFEMLDEDD